MTYKPCEGHFSSEGLKKLDPNLTSLEQLPLTAEELYHRASKNASTMSIQNLKPKLSAILNVKKNRFEVVDTEGRFILKPQHPQFPELPENEALSMRLAAEAGIDVPIHGLLNAKDNSFIYFIKRFDRFGRNKTLPVKDFVLLMDLTQETRYLASMEKVVALIDTYCTFPAIEKMKLFRLTIVNFLIGNQDMHLKKFSLITQNDKVELSPSYGILNTTIAIAHSDDEIALPLMGKRKELDRKIMVDYFGRDVLGLTEQTRKTVLDNVNASIPVWKELIYGSFLSNKMKVKYSKLLNARLQVIS